MESCSVQDLKKRDCEELPESVGTAPVKNSPRAWVLSPWVWPPWEISISEIVAERTRALHECCRAKTLQSDAREAGMALVSDSAFSRSEIDVVSDSAFSKNWKNFPDIE